MSTQNLSSDEAVQKIRKMIGSAPTCMMATELQSVPFHVCPMQVQQVDSQGQLWFFSAADSGHNEHIRKDARVQLLVSNPNDHEFLAIFGRAEVSHDPAKVEKLWSKACEAWFPEGKSDPNLTLISVRPIKSHYWDTKHGKLVTMAKILGAAISDEEGDIGVEGELTV